MAFLHRDEDSPACAQTFPPQSVFRRWSHGHPLSQQPCREKTESFVVSPQQLMAYSAVTVQAGRFSPARSSDDTLPSSCNDNRVTCRYPPFKLPRTLHIFLRFHSATTRRLLAIHRVLQETTNMQAVRICRAATEANIRGAYFSCSDCSSLTL